MKLYKQIENIFCFISFLSLFNSNDFYRMKINNKHFRNTVNFYNFLSFTNIGS